MPIRVRNISQGFIDATGFHPIRSAKDYDTSRSGEPKKYKKHPKKRATKKATKKAAKKGRKKVAKKRNPIPGKWTTAKVRRTKAGIQLLISGKASPIKRRRRTR